VTSSEFTSELTAERVFAKGREALGILRAQLKPTTLVCLDETRKIFAKLEYENPTGSFKDRPALYGVSMHQESIRKKGLLAASSGNFAQAIAHAATQIGVKARIVMTSKTSAFKVQRTERFGGEVIFAGETFESREQKTQELLKEYGSVFLHPFDCEETIFGDASMAFELDQQIQGPVDIFIPTSGGGLLAATAAVFSILRPEARVFGAQPFNNGSLERSFKMKSRQRVPPFHSVCDSLIAQIPGEKTFPLIRKFVRDVFSPTEEEVLESLRDLWNRFRIKTEPGCACAWAAVQKSTSFSDPSRSKVIVLTGANVDEAHLKQWGIE
jgi:threonine dehydratase